MGPLKVAILYHDDFKLHRLDPISHPESPRRVDLALEGVNSLASQGFERLLPMVKAPKSPLESFKLVHDKQYVDSMEGLLRSGRVSWLDPDTYVSPGTLEALLRLSGASHKAVSLALKGVSSFIVGRPPSHHAGFKGKALKAPTRGSCIFNATALIAEVLSRHGRVAVVDIDVHHGNGTQDIFYSRGDLLHIDIHQDPSSLYPYTGFPDDAGEGEGAGTKVNIVTPPASGDDVYLDALKLVDHILSFWKPEYIVVSAGFDAYRGDNDMTVTNVGTRFFHLIGRMLSSKARSVVSVLEGGYGEGLRKALPAYLLGLMGKKNELWEPKTRSSRGAWRLYRAYKKLTIYTIVEHGRIMLPEELESEIKREERVFRLKEAGAKGRKRKRLKKGWWRR
ncbi:MAG: histone deacetylase family protein [Thermoprotei archaeon]|nr:histone deacetylase family protein [Thermoprotei archaeon]